MQVCTLEPDLTYVCAVRSFVCSFRSCVLGDGDYHDSLCDDGISCHARKTALLLLLLLHDSHQHLLILRHAQVRACTHARAHAHAHSRTYTRARNAHVHSQSNTHKHAHTHINKYTRTHKLVHQWTSLDDHAELPPAVLCALHRLGRINASNHPYHGCVHARACSWIWCGWCDLMSVQGVLSML